MACRKCKGTNQQYVHGISKKNNKPWKGYKCSSCGNIEFINDEESQVKPQIKPQVQTQVKTATKMNELINTDILAQAVKLAMHTCKPSGDTAGLVMIAEVQAYYQSLLNILKNEEKF